MINLISSAAIFSPFKDVCDLVLCSKDPYSRSTKQGHITASGLVIEGDKVLPIFHPFIKQWLQPGGHIDDGESPIHAAIREVYEETGILCEPIEGQSNPVDIDLHEIPENLNKAEGAHLHIDLLFILKLLKEEESPEKIEKAWVPFDQVTSTRIKRALKTLRV